jgi:hypothetical protein
MNSTNMRIFTPLVILALMAIHNLSAEGTRQVAPNGNIDINGNATTDIAALHINNPNYNNFAAFNSNDPQSRLYIHVKDPSTECLYVGFSWAHNNVTSPDPPRINFQYQIKDPNGNVVFGPISVSPVEANIQNWSQGFNGPMQINGPSGYNATQVTSAMLGAQGWTGKGDYYIEFRDEENNDLLIDFWDITVADCSAPTPVEKLGRIWSYNWSFFAINDFGFPNRPFNGAFYVCAPDPDDEHASFVTKIDFNQSGFRPAAFNVAFNSFGSMNSGNVNEDRKSVMNTNATQAEYAIFLNDPVDICETASIGEIAILGISRCSKGDYCIKFTTTKAGQVDLLLDFDGPDNTFTPGTADRVISKTVSADEVGIPTCIPWDGLDGFGNPLPEDVSSQIPITLAYAQGIYHFPIYDAEYMTNGFMISSVRPLQLFPCCSMTTLISVCPQEVANQQHNYQDACLHATAGPIIHSPIHPVSATCIRSIHGGFHNSSFARICFLFLPIMHVTSMALIVSVQAAHPNFLSMRSFNRLVQMAPKSSVRNGRVQVSLDQVMGIPLRSMTAASIQ